MDRRAFLFTTLAAVPFLGACRRDYTPPPADPSAAGLLTEARLAELQVDPIEPLQKSRAEWRRLLSPAAFAVLFEEATERPFSSPLDKETRPGTYVCAACFLPLFTSEMKYDSRTGWPSFFTVLPGHVGHKLDLKLGYPRGEYHCVRCGGHQGHVFEDGPRPTGQRWCNNGVALRFVPASDALPPLRT